SSDRVLVLGAGVPWVLLAFRRPLDPEDGSRGVEQRLAGERRWPALLVERIEFVGRDVVPERRLRSATRVAEDFPAVSGGVPDVAHRERVGPSLVGLVLVLQGLEGDGDLPLQIG